MKKWKYLIALFGLFAIFVAGCSNGFETAEQTIKVQKRIGDEANFDYEDFKEITDQKQLQKVKDILNEIDWETAKVERAYPGHYRFIFQFKDPNIQAKAVTYELWINQNVDQVELVLDDESRYVQLDTDKSAELYEILTGEKLSERKKRLTED